METRVTNNLGATRVYQALKERWTRVDYVMHEDRKLENQEMRLNGYEANGIGDEEEDDDDEPDDDDNDDESEELL